MKPAWPEQNLDTQGHDYMLWQISRFRKIKTHETSMARNFGTQWDDYCSPK